MKLRVAQRMLILCFSCSSDILPAASTGEIPDLLDFAFAALGFLGSSLAPGVKSAAADWC